MKARYHIEGDSSNAGFRTLGHTDGFPLEEFGWLDIVEKARAESPRGKAERGAMAELDHIWEYQTGKFGVPVVIQTYITIGGGRAHGFSEYVAGDCDNVALESAPGPLFAAADRLPMLTKEEFGQLTRNGVDRPEQNWQVQLGDRTPAFTRRIDPEWELNLLYNYWKQVSLRAFDPEEAEHGRINVRLGTRHAEDTDLMRDREETIADGRSFFASVLAEKLPRQVQNIASMAAGVDAGDNRTPTTALAFVLAENMRQDITYRLEDAYIPGSCRMTAIEHDFMARVLSGWMPPSLEKMMADWREKKSSPAMEPERITFMADLRVWWQLYCIERCLSEGEQFLKDAGLMRGMNEREVSVPRAYYRMTRMLRRTMAAHITNEAELADLIRTQESVLLEKALNGMRMSKSDDDRIFAEPGIAGPKMGREMMLFHEQYMFEDAGEERLKLMTELVCADQKKTGDLWYLPSITQMTPSGKNRSPETRSVALRRNAVLLQQLLHEAYEPIIRANPQKDTREYRSMMFLGQDVLAADQFWMNTVPDTSAKAVLHDFVLELISGDENVFSTLYHNVDSKFLTMSERQNVLLAHLMKNHLTAEAGLDARRRQIVANAFTNENIQAAGREIVTGLNAYYAAYFAANGEMINRLKEQLVPVNFAGTPRMDTVLSFTMTEMLAACINGETDRELTASEVGALFTTAAGRYDESMIRVNVKAYVESTLKRRLEATQDEDGLREAVYAVQTLQQTVPENVRADTSELFPTVLKVASGLPTVNTDMLIYLFTRIGSDAKNDKRKSVDALKQLLMNRLNLALEERVLSRVAWVNEVMTEIDRRFRIDGPDQTDIASGSTIRLCKAATPMELEERKQCGEDQAVNTILEWAKNDKLNSEALRCIKDYCEDALERFEGDQAVEAVTVRFLPYFVDIDSRHRGILEVGRRKSAHEFVEALKTNRDEPISQMIEKQLIIAQRYDQQIDDLYLSSREQLVPVMQDRIARMESVQDMIAEGQKMHAPFNRDWEAQVKAWVTANQSMLFMKTANHDELQKLMTGVFGKLGIEQNAEVTAAMRTITDMVQAQESLRKAHETEVIAMTGELVRNMRNDWMLCGVLKETTAKLVAQINTKIDLNNTRRRITFLFLKASIDASQPEQINIAGILQMVLNGQKLTEASVKPYDPSNLGVLQNVMFVLQTLYTLCEQDENWKKGFRQALRSNPALNKYQKELSHDRKLRTHYGLSFASDHFLSFEEDKKNEH